MQQNPDSADYYFAQIMNARPEHKIANIMYHNNQHLGFVEANDLGISSPSFSNGAAYGDLDGDGDLDLVVNNNDHPAFIYKNNTTQSNFISVKLNGGVQNTSGIGARVSIYNEKLLQSAEHYLTRGFLSSSHDKVHFGLGANTSVDKLEVQWADGSISIIKNPKINTTHLLSKGSNQSSSLFTYTGIDSLKTTLKNFPFKHHENDFNDFAREVLLPHKMSEMGPAIAVADINGDGLEDMYIGGAIGQVGKLFVQDKSGNFVTTEGSIIQPNPGVEEVEAHFFDYDNDGDSDLYIGTGGNEFLNGSVQLQDFIYANNNGKFTKVNILPKNMRISTGAVSFYDFDSDGDVDIFIGSRQTPGNYPYASASCLLENTGGKFVDVTAVMAPELTNIGMVTSSVWLDMDKDGIDELVIAGEWMPITVMKYVNGVFINKSSEFGFDQSNGWWYSLAKGDIDNDGDMDLMAGNLGLNYKFKASNKWPFELYYGDLNTDGKTDIVLSYEQNGEYFPLRGKQCSSQQMPELNQKFPSYHLFAKSTVSQVYEGQLDDASKLSVYDFNSAVFMNEGSSFKRVNFPAEWQLFNWSDIEICDFNQDGNLDLFVAGNLFEAEVETPRCDAGVGLILQGNGTGNFERIFPTNVNWGNGKVKELKYFTLKNHPAVLIGANDSEIKYLELQ